MSSERRRNKLGNALCKLIKEQIGVPESMVEVGVCKGDTSAVIVQQFPNCKLHLVDPWKEWNESDAYWKDRRLGKLDKDVWKSYYKQAMENVNYPYNKNIRVYRTVSEEAVRQIDKADVVFIDANHDYEYVKKDIELWLPKTTKLIVFHDFGGRARGVKQAVEEAFDVSKLILGPNHLCAVNLTDGDCGCSKHKKQG